MNIILFESKPSFIPISDERAKHILTVLRLKQGDEFKAGIINGDEIRCRITSISDDGISVECESAGDLSSLFPLTLMLAEVRPISMRRILREAVSIGVGRIMLLISDLGEKSYASAGLYKSGEYKKILLDGAMQSGFTGVPPVDFFSSLDDAVASVDTDNRILLDNVIGVERLSHMHLSGSVTIAIGPERGWSDRERNVMLESGFSPAIIGNRILRTETAAVASAMMSLAAMDLI